MTDHRELDAGLALLDRQILDVEGLPVGKVDDIELSDDEGARPRVTALLLGPVALGKRIGGRLGSVMMGAGERLAHGHGPIRIPIELVKDIGVSVKLAVRVDELDRVTDLDDWLCEHFIARIPGAESASE